jgi:hypothetical protein
VEKVDDLGSPRAAPWQTLCEHRTQLFGNDRMVQVANLGVAGDDDGNGLFRARICGHGEVGTTWQRPVDWRRVEVIWITDAEVVEGGPEASE